MVNKISFFETSLFRFLTRRDATFNVSSITADDLLAYYRQENPIHKPFQIYNVIVKDLEQAIASKFFSEDIIDSLKGIRDNWQVINFILQGFGLQGITSRRECI